MEEWIYALVYLQLVLYCIVGTFQPHNFFLHPTANPNGSGAVVI
jgi:hypothetical protein